VDRLGKEARFEKGGRVQRNEKKDRIEEQQGQLTVNKLHNQTIEHSCLGNVCWHAHGGEKPVKVHIGGRGLE
jgi:hypothetical protein